jgi:hypothetical protein
VKLASGFVLFSIFLLSPCLLLGQESPRLTPGQILQGQSSYDGPAEYRFEADAAGILTIVARSTNQNDLVLLVTDADGQPLPNGRSDQDIGSDTGAEQFAVTIPRAGRYLVRVETFGGIGADFKLGASWLAFPELEVPADPDGSPSSAVRITVGQGARDDSINQDPGDYWDWFVLTAETAGTLTVLTRAAEGDLILEAFDESEYSEALQRSDQDLQGSGGNESLTLVARAGQTFYFKVAAFSDGSPVRYDLRLGFVPDGP